MNLRIGVEMLVIDKLQLVVGAVLLLVHSVEVLSTYC